MLAMNTSHSCVPWKSSPLDAGTKYLDWRVVDFAPGNTVLPVGTTVDAMERELILQTLSATGNNKTRAAELLGISLKTLHNKLKEYSGERAEGE